MNPAADEAAARIAREALEIVCAGGLERLSEYYAEDFQDHVNGMEFHGHHGARESVDFYMSMFDPLQFTVEDQVVDGQRVASRWRLDGVYRRKRVRLTGIVISRIRGGRIVEDHGVTDSLQILTALGPLRVAALAVDIARGRVRLPRSALR